MGERLINRALTHNNNWVEPFANTDMKSVSIIIPVFYPEHLDEVLEHLRFIGGYDEIIIVDDTGEIDKSKYNSIIRNSNIKIYFHKKNYGRAAARNTGAAKATGDILVFMDQDMFLSMLFLPTMQKYYASNESLVFLGIRQNRPYEEIPKSSKWICPETIYDWRIKTVIDEKFVDLTVLNVGGKDNGCKCGETISIVKKTNMLRNMGIKKSMTIGFWDLPSMVISHSMAIRKRDFINIGGFPEWIRGWGGEDIVLGFLACAAHIPIVLSGCTSYQAMHKPFSGSEENKLKELKWNINKYKNWAKDVREFPEINFYEIEKRSIVIDHLMR